MHRRCDSLKGEFEALVRSRCDCENYVLCKWHQRLHDGHALEEIVESLRQEELHDEYLDLLPRLCECTPTRRCYWHEAFTDFGCLKEVIREMERELNEQHYQWFIEQQRVAQSEEQPDQ